MTRALGIGLGYLLCGALLLASCGGDETAERAPAAAAQGEAGASETAASWRLVDTPEGAMLELASGSGVEMRLACRSEAREMLVNVPDFQPVGSEERMTFGQGGTVETFVADPAGDPVRGGVTATGPVPDKLEQLLAGRVAANYGSQNSGPHPPLPSDLVRNYLNACGTNGSAPGNGASPSNGEGAPVPARENISECLIQEGRRLPEMKLHAVGTEPFWAANVNGRCVTYSHPENIDGTRVWTEFSGSAESGTWSGYLGDQKFLMKTLPQRGCSDGMSDKRYPIAVTLSVGAEQRQGCAEHR